MSFLEKMVERKMRVLIFLQLVSETFVILRRIERDININVYCSTRKVPVFLSDVNEMWIFSADFRKLLKYQISRKFVW